MVDFVKEIIPATVVDGHLVVSAEYEARDLEKHQPRPRRKQGRRSFHTVAGFCAYTTRHKAEDTCLYGGDDKIEAVLNDHGGELPGHGDHVAVLALGRHEEREAWEQAAVSPLDQSALIDLIDERMGTIAEPAAADLAEMLATLRVTKNTKVESARDIRSGNVRVTFTDEETGSATATDIPGRIRLGLRLFDGRDVARPVDVKLSWKLVEKTIRFRVKLLNLEEALDAERMAIDAEVQKSVGLPVWR